MIKINIVSTIILLLLDGIWLYLYMSHKYSTQIFKIQGSSMKAKPIFAILSYILMVVGLNMFVLPHIRSGKELQDSLVYGFTFGIILYGVYDFTAAAVIKDWDINLAITDIIWGGFVYFTAAYLGSIIAKRI